MAEKNYYKKAKDELLALRKSTELKCDIKKEKIYEEIPKIKNIDDRIIEFNLQLFASGTGGENAIVEEVKEKTVNLRQERAKLLVDAGYPADYTDLKFSCEKCRDTGFVGINMCSCLKSRVAKERLADSDMGPLASTQKFENFDLKYYNGENRLEVEHAKCCLKKFAESFNGSNGGESWLLMGATGLGKTHLSTATGVTVINRGFDVVYKSAQSMIDDFEAEQFHGADRSIVQKYYDCDLLIIDDLGVEMNTQFSVSCIYNVINTRLNACKSTIISTNLTQKELRDRYADRITSRLFGTYKALLFGGVDIRQQKIMRK